MEVSIEVDGTDGPAEANSTVPGSKKYNNRTERYRAARRTVTGGRSAALLSLGVADEELGGR